MANTYLTKTLGTPTNNKRWTFSAWVKKSHVGSDINTLFGAGGSNSNFGSIWVNYSNGMIQFHSATSGGQTGGSVRLLNKLRDVAAWYHIVVSFDSANSTAADRVKIYINGIRGTNFDGTPDYPNLNIASFINSNIAHTVGKDSYRSAGYYNGSASHIHFIDGTVYAASSFGSTDSTTGEWTINTAPNVTYGNNGFAILKDGNTITDQSPNSNNFSLGGGAVTTIKDCPDNNFATMNPADVTKGAGTTVYTNGNTTVSISNTARNASRSSLAFTAGKFYAECKVISVGGDVRIGVMGIDGTVAQPVIFASNTNPYYFEYGYSYRTSGVKENNNNQSSYGASYGNGDIIGVAFNATNGSITFYKNGASQGVAFSSLNSNYWVFYCTLLSSASVSWNFGNGFFGTTAITTNSGNGYAGADGKSKFNYAVPSAHSALSTKGLNQ